MDTCNQENVFEEIFGILELKHSVNGTSVLCKKNNSALWEELCSVVGLNCHSEGQSQPFSSVTSQQLWDQPAAAELPSPKSKENGRLTLSISRRVLFLHWREREGGSLFLAKNQKFNLKVLTNSIQKASLSPRLLPHEKSSHSPKTDVLCPSQSPQV